MIKQIAEPLSETSWFGTAEHFKGSECRKSYLFSPSSDPSQVKHLMPIKITVGAEEIEDGINKECQVDCGAYVLNRIWLERTPAHRNPDHIRHNKCDAYQEHQHDGVPNLDPLMVWRDAPSHLPCAITTLELSSDMTAGCSDALYNHRFAIRYGRIDRYSIYSNLRSRGKTVCPLQYTRIKSGDGL